MTFINVKRGDVVAQTCNLQNNDTNLNQGCKAGVIFILMAHKQQIRFITAP